MSEPQKTPAPRPENPGDALETGPFFVGFFAVPHGLRAFLLGMAIGLMILAGGLAYAIGTTQDDPGDGAFRFDLGRQTVTGVVELTPIPVLHVTEGTEQIPAGHTLMMSGPGKRGVLTRPAAKQGQLAQVSGVLLQRGTLDMLQVAGRRNAFQAVEGPAPMPEPVDLGRWRLAGEICDGKCLAGAMRPGRGLAHKACANLCVLGGVPPVFVSTQPVEGSEFLLIAGPDGTPIPEAVYDWMAQFISVKGQIRRHGDLLVFAMDPASIRALP
ncbi:MAG: hypothetical protein AAF631_09790 [Pseudomonadota bacterium]